MQNVMNEPKITIGMPVYNGENFIQKSIESLLKQTYKNFELIISDNASTDSTKKICEQYLKADPRIRYIYHKKNLGAIWNFNFLLQNAKSDYFMWAAVDDYWLPKFLEINIEPLTSDKNFVGSMSQIKLFNRNNEKLKNSETKFEELRLKIIKLLRKGYVWPLDGTYEKKVRTLFKHSAYSVIYGVFRTKILQKSMLNQSFLAPDVAWVLNILKFGDINVNDEVLMYKYEGGVSSKGSITQARIFNKKGLGLIFPHYPLTAWCSKNLGPKIFLKNIDHFILLNLGSLFFVFLDFFGLVIKKFSSK